MPPASDSSSAANPPAPRRPGPTLDADLVAGLPAGYDQLISAIVVRLKALPE